MERVRRFLPLAQKAFSAEKFILGLPSLELTSLDKKLRRLFKVYEPTLDQSLYESHVLNTMHEVDSS